MQIVKATENDLSGIVGLMRDFAEYEKLADYCEITEEKLAQAMFGDGAFVEGLAAYDDTDLIAYALFYPSFASFRGQRGFYLEDIFIDDRYRGQGIGEAMLKEIAREAKTRGYERIDFQVLNWNAPAINFYENRGAVSNSDESHFKFAGEAFERLAG